MNKNKKVLLSAACILILIIAGIAFYIHRQIVLKERIAQFEIRRGYDEAFAAGDMDKAIAIGQQLVDRDPDNVENLQDLGAAYLNKGSLSHQESEYAPKGAEIARRIIKLDPEYAEGYHLLGYALEIQQLYLDAVSQYARAIALDTGNARYYNSRGHAYDLSGDLNSAIKDYRQAHTLDPLDTAVHMNLARTYLALRDMENAEKYAWLAINMKPEVAYNKATGYGVLGQIALHNSKPTEAYDYYTQAIKTLPTFAPSFVGRATAVIYFTTPLTDAAAGPATSDLMKAIQLDPNNTNAYLTLGDMKRLQGKKPEAVVNYLKAISVLDADLTIGRGQKDVTREYLMDNLSLVK